jgi:FeS assembly SUF system protein
LERGDGITGFNAAAKEDQLLSELQNQDISAEQAQAIAEAPTYRDKLIAVLKTVRDPEMPVNIWDLGLVYRLEVTDRQDVAIDMTLTAPGCPVAGAMPEEVKKRINKLVPETRAVDVQLVWQPRWHKDMMSDEAKLLLDMW